MMYKINIAITSFFIFIATCFASQAVATPRIAAKNHDAICAYQITKVSNKVKLDFNDTDKVRATIADLVIPPRTVNGTQQFYEITTSSYTCTNDFIINIQTPTTEVDDKCYQSIPINIKSKSNGKYWVKLKFPDDFTYKRCKLRPTPKKITQKNK